MTMPRLNKTIVYIPCLLVVLCSACHHSVGSEEQLKEDVDSFATYYYNWHFEKALKYCTPESEKWLRYASSNVQEEDVALLKAKEGDATIELQDITFASDNDTIATVSLVVYDVLTMKEIGRPAQIIDQATYTLPLVFRNGKWLVRMEDLPRSERQNHGSDVDE